MLTRVLQNALLQAALVLAVSVAIFLCILPPLSSSLFLLSTPHVASP